MLKSLLREKVEALDPMSTITMSFWYKPVVHELGRLVWKPYPPRKNMIIWWQHPKFEFWICQIWNLQRSSLGQEIVCIYPHGSFIGDRPLPKIAWRSVWDVGHHQHWNFCNVSRSPLLTLSRPKLRHATLTWRIYNNGVPPKAETTKILTEKSRTRWNDSYWTW